MQMSNSKKLLGKEIEKLLVRELRKMIWLQGRTLRLIIVDTKRGNREFRVSPKGDIEQRLMNGWTKEGVSYRFTLARPGKSLTCLFRSRHDLISVFVKYIAQISPTSVNSREVSRLALIVADERVAVFLSRLNQRYLKLSRSLTSRHELSFFAFGLLSKYGGVRSVVWFRLVELKNSFPSLFHIFPLPLLIKNVLEKQALRKLVPYWSKPVRLAAEKPYKNYSQAHLNLVLASLEHLGINHQVSDLFLIRDCLRLVRFDPFEKLDRCREAFLRWIIPRAEDRSTIAREFAEIYQFVCETRYVISDKNTLRGLMKRHQRWLKQRFEERMEQCIGSNRPFPQPWLGYRSWLEDYQFDYVSTPKDLFIIAHEMNNCLFNYLGFIQDGYKQIYTFSYRNELIGAISIHCHEGIYSPGEWQFKGSLRRRGPISYNLLTHWFMSRLAVDDDRPDLDEIPEEDQLEIPYEVILAYED